MAVVANLTTLFHAKVDKYKSDILGVRMTWEQIGTAAKELGITGKGAAATFNRMLQQVEQAVLSATPKIDMIREQMKMLNAMFQNGRFAPELYARAMQMLNTELAAAQANHPGKLAFDDLTTQAMSKSEQAYKKFLERQAQVIEASKAATAAGFPVTSGVMLAAQERNLQLLEQESGEKRKATRERLVSNRWEMLATETKAKQVTVQQLLNRELARMQVMLRRGLITQTEFTQGVKLAKREALGAANVFEGWVNNLRRSAGIIKTVIVGLTAAKVFGGISQGISDAFELESQTRRASVAFDGQGIEEIRAMSLALGMDTGFAGNALDAAKAIEELGKSGRNLESSLRSARDVLMFMQGGDFQDIESAVRTASSVQAAMRLRFLDDPQKDAAAFRYVTDVITKAGQVSITSAEEIGKAFQNVGATASLMGYSLLDTAAAIVVLTDQGKKGLEAGTELAIAIREIGSAQLELPSATEMEKRSAVLRQYFTTAKEMLDAMKQMPTSMLEEKLGITFYDKATGEARLYRDVIVDLNRKLKDLTPFERQRALKGVIPERATKFALAFLDFADQMGGDVIGKIQQQMANYSGSTAAAAEQSMTSLQKVLKSTRGEFSALASVAISTLEALAGGFLALGLPVLRTAASIAAFSAVLIFWTNIVRAYVYVTRTLIPLLRSVLTLEALLASVRSASGGGLLKIVVGLGAAAGTFVGLNLLIEGAFDSIQTQIDQQLAKFEEQARRGKGLQQNMEEIQSKLQSFKQDSVSPLETFTLKLLELDAVLTELPNSLTDRQQFRLIDQWLGQYQSTLAELPGTVANAAAVLSGSREAFSLRNRVEVKGGRDERMLQQMRAQGTDVKELVKIAVQFRNEILKRPVSFRDLQRKAIQY